MVVAFDLDDTLYHEIEYVRSAYRAIARIHGAHLLPLMMNAPTPADAFDATGIEIGTLLHIYRTHVPDIRLPMSSLYVLVWLYKKGYKLALITDGRSITQQHKITALGLDGLIASDLIYISETFGEEKLTGGAMRDIMKKYPEEKYLYVGDNLQKDFVRGNELGWKTICLKASAENIFPQDFEKAEMKFQPMFIVKNLYELVGLVQCF